VGVELEVVEAIDAEALLLPVDGRLCVLGGAATNAIRAALAADEIESELEFLTHQLKTLRPLADGDARVIDGVARWSRIVVSAAYPHNVNDKLFSMGDCARILRVSIGKAIEATERADLRSLAMTVIGTSHRLTPDLATSAIADGIASARKSSVMVRWAIPDSAIRTMALAHSQRLGLS
jgi:hypothetical protein